MRLGCKGLVSRSQELLKGAEGLFPAETFCSLIQPSWIEQLAWQGLRHTKASPRKRLCPK